MNMLETDKGVCVDGFKAAGVREGKYGVALIAADCVCEAAGVFTKNSVTAAPVAWTRRIIKNGLQAVVANSGCANACVKEGLKDARKMAKLAGSALNVEKTHVGVASTGIIGRRINLEVVEKLVQEASAKLSKSSKASMDAAKALMTTDTTPKQVSAEHNGIQVGGICKGAGMIAPDMATMLCFITTNAEFTGSQLKTALATAVGKSFNMTAIDGDMSTNDTVVLLASGKKKCNAKTFQKLLDYVTLRLAQMIARDGEGASKYLVVDIINAKNESSAVKAAKAVITSPLVKTALYGENPNWGRIMSSIGSRIRVKPMNVTITFTSAKGSVRVFDRGRIGNLEKARKILKEKDITATVNLRLGKSKATAYGCDLTEEYVRINAGYN